MSTTALRDGLYVLEEVELAEAVEVLVGVPVAALCDELGVFDKVALGDTDVLTLLEIDGEALIVAEVVIVEDGDSDKSGVSDAVALREAETEGERVVVPEGVVTFAGIDGKALGEKDVLALAEIDEEALTVAEAVIVEDGDSATPGVSDAVALREAEVLALAEIDEEALRVAEADADVVIVEDGDSATSGVSDAVALGETVVEALAVALGEADVEALAVADADDEGVIV